jgi:hypothetical protein
VTNETNCPLKGVIAVVIPFVPRGAIINQIPDPEKREHIQEVIDNFCAAGEFDLDIGDAEAVCTFDGGDIVCHIELPPGVELPGGLQETLDLGEQQQNSQIACTSDGVAINCRIPQSVLATANETLEEQGEQQIPLICLPTGPVVLCTALTLSVGEMQMEDFDLVADQTGVFHHYVVAFSTASGGVCRVGLPGTGCAQNSDCQFLNLPPNAECESGICSGSSTPSLNGRGCDPAVASHCTGGTCTDCGVVNGNLLSGVACETTIVGPQAPAISSVGLAMLALAMFLSAAYILRRHAA